MKSKDEKSLGAFDPPKIDDPSAGPTVSVAATFRVYDGYGSMGEYMVLGMSRAGASVNVLPILIDERGTSEEFRQIVARSRARPVGPVLYFCGPSDWLDPYRQVEDLFINTMWEADRLPALWPERLNLARAVVVPSRFLVGVCRQSGVTVPVEVVAQGVDPEIYRYQERPARETLTTLMVGTVDERKNIEVGIEAWRRAFANDPSARLVIKSRFGKGSYEFADARIRFHNESEITRGIAHWYAEADVLLALGNEGFGLPLVEGMATGLPVVALDSEGQRDVCEEAGELVLSVKPATRKQYVCDYWGPAGVRGVPSAEDVAARLRWVAEHREEARALGAAASRWALKHRDIWKMGPAVLDIMEHYSRPPRSLRRAPESSGGRHSR